MIEMRKKGFGMFLLIGIFIFGFSFVYGAQGFANSNSGGAFGGATSSFQYQSPSFNSYYPAEGVVGGQIGRNEMWPIFNEIESGQCEASTDFIVAIRPGSCTPQVVRSDLLAEQNVPVFCQLDAVKVNPLIKVSSIKSITFKGDYPDNVAGISFHPARAAVRTYDTLLGSPLINNIGYVVIVLKQGRNESALPDFVSGNLTATIYYDAEEAFGVGRAEYYLPIIDNDEWENNYASYGFWQGRGFLRAESVDSEGAKIGLYTKKDRLFTTVNLGERETSRELYFPGFYCQAGVQVKLNGITIPEKQVKLNVDGDEIWVREGQKFLNDKCRVREISALDDGTGGVSISCPGERFNLLLQKEGARMSVDGNVKDVNVGEEVGRLENKKVYLAYVGTIPKKVKRASGDEFVLLVDSVDSLAAERLVNVVKRVEEVSRSAGELNGREEFEAELGKAVSGLFGGGKAYVVLKENSVDIKESEDSANEINFKFVENSNAISEKTYTDVIIEKNFLNSNESVEDLLKLYPQEKTSLEVYGEESLWRQIELADILGKQESVKGYLERFMELYPESVRMEVVKEKLFMLSSYNYENSRVVVHVNNRFHFIKAEKFKGVGKTEKNIYVTSDDGVGYFAEGDRIYLEGELDRAEEGESVEEESEVVSYTEEELESLMAAIKPRSSLNNGNSPRSCDCSGDSDCDNYAQFIWDASKEYDVDALRILAIMAQENNCKNENSFDGDGNLAEYGVMQITPETGREYCDGLDKPKLNEWKSSAQANINCGAKILKEKYSQGEAGHCDGTTYSGWDAALRRYNGIMGGDDCSDLKGNKDYVEEVKTLYEQLKQKLSSLKSGNSVSESKEGNEDYLLVKKIDAFQVELVHYEYNNRRNKYDTKRVVLKEGADVLKSGRSVILNEINAEKVAHVSLIPNVKNTDTEADFTFKVGIEKRNIQITPEKANEKINNLNKTIEDLENLNTKLEKTIKGWTGACFATQVALTAKNFLLGGAANIARQSVMKGYRVKCDLELDNGPLYNRNACYDKYSDDIDRDVDIVKTQISTVNDRLQGIQRANMGSEGVLGIGGVVDTPVVLEEYRKQIGTTPTKVLVDGKEKSILISEIDSIETLREIDLLNGLVVAGVGGVTLESVRKELNAKLLPVYQKQITGERLTASIGSVGVGPDLAKRLQTSYQSSISASSKMVAWSGTVFNVSDKSQLGISSEFTKYQFKGHTDSRNYFFMLSDGVTENTLEVKEIFERTGNGATEKLNSASPELLSGNNLPKYWELRRAYTFVQGGNCQGNKIADSSKKAIFYETGVNQNLPAIVPFDDVNGWYVKVPQTSGGFFSESVDGYRASGDVSFFYIANVGKNGIMENLGGDDVYQSFDVNSYAGINDFYNCPSLDANAVQNLAKDAQRAVKQAAQQFSGRGDIMINLGVGKSISLQRGPPVSGEGNAVECQDSMSPSDCKLLFNVCDPVICPSSRCDLGGKRPVASVPATGVIGSIALCLPNAQEGIAVPVCLTGIQAGLEAYNTVLKSERDCLEQNLETGEYVGICDEITAVYRCEFFWRQAAPLSEVILPSLLGKLSGNAQGARGGGEYLTIKSAWENLQGSLGFFQDSYAQETFRAFKLTDVREAGSTFCQQFLGTGHPSSGNFLDRLLEPESPSQFYAKFSEVPFSDASVPATSQYKVFYHIFAGDDEGSQFSVYLKNPPASSYYGSNPQFFVESGYINKGDYATNTNDFIAPAGYKELCVVINGFEHCGFKQVTTDFGAEYLRDKYVEDQANERNIKTEKDCVSGTPSLWALPNTNVQAGVEESLNPSIALNGVVRFCASRNPGQNVNEDERYVEAGYCGDESRICWLDMKSVDARLQQVRDLEGTLEGAGQYAGRTDEGATNSEIDTKRKLEDLRNKIESFELEVTKSADLGISLGETGKLGLGSQMSEIIGELNNLGGLGDAQATGSSKVDKAQLAGSSNVDKAEAISLKAEVYRIIVRSAYARASGEIVSFETIIEQKKDEVEGEESEDEESDEDLNKVGISDEKVGEQEYKIEKILLYVDAYRRTVDQEFYVGEEISIRVNYLNCDSLEIRERKKFLGFDFLNRDSLIEDSPSLIEDSPSSIFSYINSKFTPDKEGDYLFKVYCRNSDGDVKDEMRTGVISVVEAPEVGETSPNYEGLKEKIEEIKFDFREIRSPENNLGEGLYLDRAEAIVVKNKEALDLALDIICAEVSIDLDKNKLEGILEELSDIEDELTEELPELKELPEYDNFMRDIGPLMNGQCPMVPTETKLDGTTN
jgi:hypothetical protein